MLFRSIARIKRRTPIDFRALHDSMMHALTVGAKKEAYYRYRTEQDDGGYLHALVDTCQETLEGVRHYELIAPFLHELASYYCDLQVHKHVKKEERVPRLKQWFAQYEASLPKMEWYEFSACSGSTLGIFCLSRGTRSSFFTCLCTCKSQ